MRRYRTSTALEFMRPSATEMDLHGIAALWHVLPSSTPAAGSTYSKTEESYGFALLANEVDQYNDAMHVKKMETASSNERSSLRSISREKGGSRERFVASFPSCFPVLLDGYHY